ncbi:MAG: prolipoprotein diacylglyceryl transferase [Bacteroidales bacterium]|nr:prolipoprotein diacylglyceryl transferase [Bacteroidales bacterium]
MYPTLSDFLREVLGINVPLPIQSYGFLFALAFITGTLIYAAEYKRKEKLGSLIPFYVTEKVGAPATPAQLFWTFILMFLVGFKGIEAIFHYNEFVNHPQDMILSARGSFVGGLIVGIGSTVYTWWEKNRKKLPMPELRVKEMLPHQIVGNMLIFVGLWGLLGAKVFDAIQPDNFSSFIKDPIGELLSFSGLTFYGGIIVGFAAGVYYIRKYNINLLQSIDAFSPAAALAYAVGRLGCQVSGDGCWGVVNTSPKPNWLSFLPDWAWSYDYPHNVLDYTSVISNPANANLSPQEVWNTLQPLSEPVFPTPLYESTIMFVAFIILWSLRKHIKIPGIIFSMYLIFAGLERYFIETIRVTNRYDLGLQLSQAQIISILMVIAGVGMIIYMIIKKDKFIELGKTKPREINDPELVLKKAEEKEKITK